MFHGADRDRDHKLLAKQHLVISTYQTVASEFDRKTNGIFKVSWLRMVLDEVKRKKTKKNKSVTLLGPSNPQHDTAKYQAFGSGQKIFMGVDRNTDAKQDRRFPRVSQSVESGSIDGECMVEAMHLGPVEERLGSVIGESAWPHRRFDAEANKNRSKWKAIDSSSAEGDFGETNQSDKQRKRALLFHQTGSQEAVSALH